MRFYNQLHKFYCGIDLHARKMYVCILDQKGKTKVHENINIDPELLFDLIFPLIENVVICVECTYNPYVNPDFSAFHNSFKISVLFGFHTRI